MIDNKKEKIKELFNLYNGDIRAIENDVAQYINTSNITSSKRPTIVDNISHKNMISLQNIYKKYKLGGTTVNALQDISLTINKGEFIAITGASGSGKSTLLQIIGCLDKPTSGNVIIDQIVVSELKDNSLSMLRQNTIGFIFQSFYLQPFLNLRDNITVPAMFTNDSKKLINTKVNRLLERVGLSERAAHYPKELSGGQIQRAAIARALMNSPDIILADEPTGNLDSKNSESIIELFRHIRDTLGTTVIVVTHDTEIASKADRIIVLEDGKIV